MIYSPTLNIDVYTLKSWTMQAAEKLYDYGISVQLSKAGKFKDIKEEITEEDKYNIYYRGGSLDWLIYLGDNPIGSICAEDYDEEMKSMNMGCFVSSEDYNTLYEIMTNVMDYIFSNFDVEKLIYVEEYIDIVKKDNINKSILLENIGFFSYSNSQEKYNNVGLSLITEKSIISKEEFYKRNSDIKKVK